MEIKEEEEMDAAKLILKKIILILWLNLNGKDKNKCYLGKKFVLNILSILNK